MTDIQKRYYTPPELAQILDVAHGKVLAWIRSGELPAVDLSTDRRERPRYKVSETDLKQFLSVRSTKAKPVTTGRRAKRQRTAADDELY